MRIKLYQVGEKSMFPNVYTLIEKKTSTFLAFVVLSTCLLLLYMPSHGSAQEKNTFLPKKIENITLNATPKAEDRGGQIVFGTIGEASNLIPYLATDTGSHEVAGNLYVSLLRYDKNLRIEPYAAKSYTVSEDGKHISFVLREGILWQDGVELTADDVEFTWKIVTDPKTASPYAGDFLAVKEFVKTGRYSFEVHYEKYFSGALTSWGSAILPKHILEGQDLRNTPFARNPIGAGPYKMHQWVPGSTISLKASDTYFEGKPYIETIVYRFIPDLSTMFLETRAGSLDMMGLTPLQYLRQTNGEQWESRFNKYKYLSSTYVFLGYNMQHPFFKDLRVRQALTHAIDKEGIVKGVLMGEGVASFGPYKPGSWAYHPTLNAKSYDIQKAKKLLHEAGFADNNGDGILEKDGKNFSFTILTNQGNEQRILTATVIQSQLKAIGIESNVRTVEWAAFIKEFINKGRFDAVILGWTMGNDPDIYDVWHSSKATEGGLNFTRYINARVDEILEEARSTPDTQLRTKLYHELQEIFAAEQPYTFLYVPYALPILQKRFHGVEPALAGIMYNFDKWWVPKALQK